MNLTDQDFKGAAAVLGCPVAAVKAVCEVEAPSGGFDTAGQPRILFEAHTFSELTGGLYDKSHPWISSPVWNRSLYATGPTADARNTAEHKRLQEASQLNRNAALMSASWGKFQILGSNFSACDFPRLQDFINAMYKSESAHLAAFVAFVQNDRGGAMQRALKSLDWATFSRLYNGTGYAQNHYDTKLAAAFKAAQ